MTDLQLKKALAPLIGCHHGEISSVTVAAWRVTVEKTVPGTSHVRSTETYTLSLS